MRVEFGSIREFWDSLSLLQKYMDMSNVPPLPIQDLLSIFFSTTKSLNNTLEMDPSLTLLFLQVCLTNKGSLSQSPMSSVFWIRKYRKGSILPASPQTSHMKIKFMPLPLSHFTQFYFLKTGSLENFPCQKRTIVFDKMKDYLTPDGVTP